MAEINFEEIFEEQMRKNEPFREFFEKHPEKKEAYIAKLEDEMHEVFGCKQPNPKYCRTCMFVLKKDPFGELPDNAYCRMFPEQEHEGKPNDVYFDGAECEYYEKKK